MSLRPPADLTQAQLIDIQIDKIHTAVLTIKALMAHQPAEQLTLAPEPLPDEYAPADLQPEEVAAADAIE